MAVNTTGDGIDPRCIAEGYDDPDVTGMLVSNVALSHFNRRWCMLIFNVLGCLIVHTLCCNNYTEHGVHICV